MATVFFGRFQAQLDPKNRLVFPARFRDAMSVKERRLGFYLVRGLDGCLSLYPLERWEALSVEIAQLSAGRPEHRHFRRMLFSSAHEVTLDGQNRILVPDLHQEIAGISKEVIFTGERDHVDLWSPDRLRDYESSHAADFDESGGLVLEQAAQRLDAPQENNLPDAVEGDG